MKLLITISFLLTTLFVFAQENIPIGTWRTHFSYNSAKTIAVGDNKVFVAAESGIFIYDKSDNSISTLGKINGLQEDNVASLYYDELRNTLIIGYTSGNIDVLRENEILSLDLLTNSQVLGSKKINNVIADNNFAYISTDYGLLKFGLDKLEVTETYRQLGQDASQIKVFQSAILGDSIFLATESGIIASNINNNTNLFDPINWKRHDQNNGLPVSSAQIIFKLDSKILAGFQNQGLYIYNSGTWMIASTLQSSDFISAYSDGSEVAIIADDILYIIDDVIVTTPISDPLIMSLSYAIVFNGDIFIADEINGLLTNVDQQFQSIKPSGPVSNEVFNLYYRDNEIIGLSGGYNDARQPFNSNSGFYSFKNGGWTNYNNTNLGTDTFNDVVDVAYDASTQAHYYASFGYGLLKIDDAGIVSIINENSSTLQNISVNQPSVYVTAVESSKEGLWVLNYGASSVLNLLSGGEWQIPISLNTNMLTDITNTQRQLWMIVDPNIGGGILVFDKASEQTRYLTSQSGNGGLPNSIVNSMAVDQDGSIWVGTNEGVAVFSNPNNILEGNVDAILPIFENRQLLRDERITSIKVDNGNRKWIGTQSGVWLFDENADLQLENFNILNSPLPSNSIIDIEINEVTGEVFFATSNGIISYRGTATEAKETHSTVKIFPNPVTADFMGTIGISGLAKNVNVKITDSNGKLIWNTKSEGGTAVWNSRDYNGNRASTGIYFVFSSSQDGEETFIGKIAVVN
jgi:hypothetical protein